MVLGPVCCLMALTVALTLNKLWLQVYQEEATPVERFFRERGLLLDFEITGGIPETLPRLQSKLQPYVSGLRQRVTA